MAINAGFCLIVSPCLVFPFFVKICGYKGLLPATVDVGSAIVGFASEESVCTYVEHRKGIFCLSQLPTVRSYDVSLMSSESNTRPVAYRKREPEGNDLKGISVSFSASGNMSINCSPKPRQSHNHPRSLS